MSSPTNVNLSDLLPAPKPDSANVEWQAGNAIPDPNSPGNYVRDTSACYRFPPVGGVFVIDDTNFVSPYLLSINDSGQILVINAAAAFTLQFPSTAPAFASPAQGVWNVTIINIGATVTLDRNTRNLDGAAANLTLEQFQAITFSTDGTDYWSGTKASGFVGGVVANTGTSVTLGNTHRQKLLTTSNSSAVAVTLDSTVGKGFIAWHINLGSGTATLTPSSGTINGAANLAVTTGSGCTLFFDGTNWKAVTGGGGGGGMTNPMTALGDTIYEDATPAAARLAGNTTTTRKFLRQTGTGTISAVPAWDTLVAGDVPNLDASKITTGQLALARGGTGVDLSAAGGTTKILAQDASHVISARDLVAADIPIRNGGLYFNCNGAGVVPTTGVKARLIVPYDCTITQWTLTADQSGSVQLDIKHSTYSGFPTTSSIVASAPPAISSAQKAQSSTLTGWTTSLTKGDVLEFYVSSISTITVLELELAITRSN